jgi:hypothetical protein
MGRKRQHILNFWLTKYIFAQDKVKLIPLNGESDYFANNYLRELQQSAYKCGHSREYALIQLKSDIMT